MRLIRNARTLLGNKAIARDYLSYWASKLVNSGRAVRTFPGGIKIAELNSFSEFHSVRTFINSEEQRFLSDYPVGPGAIIDVGANLGVVSCLLARRFPDRIIHSFEPNPSTFQALNINVALNSCSNVLSIPYAIADRDGEVSFVARPDGRATASITQSPGEHVTTVPCITLDTYAGRNSIDDIAFLKVDVEGYEAAVFQGAGRILNQQQAEIIYYEVCPANYQKCGLDPELPTRILQQNGYKIYKTAERAGLTPVHITEVGRTVLENWIALRS